MKGSEDGNRKLKLVFSQGILHFSRRDLKGAWLAGRNKLMFLSFLIFLSPPKRSSLISPLLLPLSLSLSFPLSPPHPTHARFSGFFPGKSVCFGGWSMWVWRLGWAPFRLHEPQVCKSCLFPSFCLNFWFSVCMSTIQLFDRYLFSF